MADILPVKGFVFRRKQYFASFENIPESVNLCMDGATDYTGNGKPGMPSKDKKWRLSNADISFQQKVVAFEQYAQKDGRSRRDSCISNVSVGDYNLTGPEHLRDLDKDNSMTKWSSLPLLDDQITFQTELETSAVSESNGGTDFNANQINSSTILNENIVNSAPNTDVIDGLKQSKPHWTTVFSQRLNQIRQRFETKSKTDHGKTSLIRHSNVISQDPSYGNLRSSQIVTKSCLNLYEQSLPCKERFKRNTIRTSSSNEYKQTQSWLEKNLVLKSKAKSGASDECNEKSRLATAVRPNLTDSEKIQLVNNEHYTRFSQKCHIGPDIIQPENESVSLSSAHFPGRVKESRRQKEPVDDVVPIKIVETFDDVDLNKAPVPPILVPSQGFTADEKIKDRTTLRDWDPVSISESGVVRERTCILCKRSEQKPLSLVSNILN